MPKRKLTINRFDAGMVHGPNPRDIADSAGHEITGLDPSDIGALKTLGVFSNTELPDLGKVYGYLCNMGAPTMNATDPGFGYGLCQFVSDMPNLGLHYSKKIQTANPSGTGLDVQAYNRVTDYLRNLARVNMNSATQGWLRHKDFIDSEPLTDDAYDSSDNDYTYPDVGDKSPFNFSGKAMYVTNPRPTLYTMLWCHHDLVSTHYEEQEYEYGDAATQLSNNNTSATPGTGVDSETVIGLDERPSHQGGFFGPLIHEYSLDDDGATTNQWYRPWRKMYTQLASPVFSSALSYPNGSHGLQYRPSFHYYHNENLYNPSVSMTLGGSDVEVLGAGGTLNWWFQYSLNILDRPNTPYKPKFYMVDGYPRVYDETSQGMHYIVKYVRSGLSSNIQGGTDAYSELAHPGGYYPQPMQVNQWVIEPNYFLPFGNHPARGVGNEFVDAQADGLAYWQRSGTLQWGGLYEDTFAQHGGYQYVGPVNNGCMQWLSPYLTTDADTPKEITDNLLHQKDMTPSGMSEIDIPFSSKTMVRFLNESETGGWLAENGKPLFYHALMFDGKQQGPLTNVGNAYYYGPGSNNNYTDCKMLISGGTLCENNDVYYSYDDNGRDTVHNQPRVAREAMGLRATGYRLFYAYRNDDDGDAGTIDSNIYLLVEVDFDKGWRIAGDLDFRPLRHNAKWKHIFNEPPTYEDFTLLNGYRPGQETNAQFKTAVYTKGRTWIGNVTQRGVNYPDRILKSPIGTLGPQPDIFPEENFLDLSISDGDGIVHLEALGDDLLVFKSKSLYIIDISSIDDEKVKTVSNGNGIAYYWQTAKTNTGIAWINKSGCWHYDGTDIVNLLQEEGIEKIDLKFWQTALDFDGGGRAAKCDIEYSVKSDKLIVVQSLDPGNQRGGCTFMYHFGTKSWCQGIDVFPQAAGAEYWFCSNMIKDHNNDIVMAGINHGSSSNSSAAGDPSDARPWNGESNASGNDVDHFGRRIEFFKWYESWESGSGGIPQGKLVYITKDFDFGNLGAKKSIKKYI